MSLAVRLLGLALLLALQACGGKGEDPSTPRTCDSGWIQDPETVQQATSATLTAFNHSACGLDSATYLKAYVCLAPGSPTAGTATWVLQTPQLPPSSLPLAFGNTPDPDPSITLCQPNHTVYTVHLQGQNIEHLLNTGSWSLTVSMPPVATALVFQAWRLVVTGD